MAQKKAGAGGYWSVIDEHSDPSVIKQFTADACAAACGEMVLRDRNITIIYQQEIARVAGGVPVDLEDLAIALNQLGNLPGLWRGMPVQIPRATDIELLQALHTTGSWIAGFWEEGRPIGHAVVVDGFDSEARLLIRDPWGETVSARYGSRYIMELHSFLAVWSRFAAFYLNLSQP
jgi:hypothetical protein